MNYSKQYISKFGNKTGFINSNIEKVIRLLDVLCFIGSELDPEHKKWRSKAERPSIFYTWTFHD